MLVTCVSGSNREVLTVLDSGAFHQARRYVDVLERSGQLGCDDGAAIVFSWHLLRYKAGRAERPCFASPAAAPDAAGPQQEPLRLTPAPVQPGSLFQQR